MSTVQPRTETAVTALVWSRWDLWRRGLGGFLRNKPLGAVGGGILILMVVVAILAPLLAREDPSKAQTRLAIQPPNVTAPLGRDGSGRDILSRLIYGAQVSVGVGFSATLLSVMLQSAIGLISAYKLGWTDLFFQRFVDAVQSLPQLVVLMVVATVLPRGPLTLIILLGLLNGIRGSRVVRSAVLSVRQNDYITAAQAIGASDTRIILQHLLPNVFAPIMVVATVNLGGIILTEASLSFLGLGLVPPTVSWGQMLSIGGAAGIAAMIQGPWIALAPGFCITAAVYGINMLGDALRDVLDPRLRGTGGGG